MPKTTWCPCTHRGLNAQVLVARYNHLRTCWGWSALLRRRNAYAPAPQQQDPVASPRDARSRVLRRRLRGQAPERLQRWPTTKTPWLGLETPARSYRGGDFVDRLLNDFNGSRRPRPRWLGLEAPARTYRGGAFVARLLNDFSGGNFVARLLNDFSGGRRPRPRGARTRTAGSAPNVND